MSEQKPKRGLFREEKPKKPAPAKLETIDKVRRALASQSRPQTLAESLGDKEQAAIAATVGDDGFATPKTVEVVRTVVAAFYDRHKAVDGDQDQPAPSPAAAAATPAK